MRPGFIISTLAHASLILWAVLGGWFLSPREAEVVKVADVSFITAAEFEAAQSAAPSSQETEISDLKAPVSDLAPEIPTVTQDREMPREPVEMEEAAVLEAAPEIPLTPDQVATPEPLGAEIAIPGAEEGASEPERAPSTELATAAPALSAPKIDARPAPKPPEPVKEAERETPETVIEPEVSEPVEETEPAAPQEATPEITLKAEDDSSTTPLVAARPKGRPSGLKKSSKEPVRTVEATPKSETETVKPAQPARPAQEPSRYVLGSDMSRTEKFAIAGQIENRWNIASFEGRPNWENLVVVVEVQLTQSGKVMNKTIRAYEPKSPTGDLKTAYSAARRAILMAQPFDLPADKFRDGDWLRIRFNPASGGVTLN